MQEIVNKLIALVLKFLPETGKTFMAAAVAAALAINAALGTLGIVFLPEGVVVVLGWIAVALGLVGLRHGQMKLEGSVNVKKLSNGVRHLAILFAFGLMLLCAMGCSLVGVNGGCDCSPCCNCTLDDCQCCPGNKCCPECKCREKPPACPTCPGGLSDVSRWQEALLSVTF